ncbi:MAG: type II secretion system F family protein [Planctomycetota bacterium]|nr:type II secretion system F family protein [Planctomycetota bacterium]MDA1252207.1 type II secretion system F family protein [Planctomycetota bacterium]
MTITEITLILSASVTIVVYLLGMAVINSRRRVRNIHDVDRQIRANRPGWFRRSLAEVLPQPKDEVERVGQDLKRAGFYGANAVIEFRSTRNLLVLAIVVMGVGSAVAARPGTDLPRNLLIVSLCAAAVAYVGPRFVIHLQAMKRLNSIQRGLPDALDIIHMCLTGGLPLRDSLARVSKEVEFFHPDVAVELEVVRRHAEMDSMAKALREFSRRMNAPDVNALATLVTQSERTGTNVAVAVTEFADGIRRQFRQRAEERAGKTSIRMLFPVILCLSPPVMILLLGPPVLQLRDFLQNSRKPGGVLESNSFGENRDALGN